MPSKRFWDWLLSKFDGQMDLRRMVTNDSILDQLRCLPAFRQTLIFLGGLDWDKFLKMYLFLIGAGKLNCVKKNCKQAF